MKKIINFIWIIALGFGAVSFSSIQSEKKDLNMFQTQQWVKLGSRVVNMKADHDEIMVHPTAGVFSKLKFKVLKAPILVKNIKIVFGNGDIKNIVVNRKFPPGTSSKIIDLYGNRRIIKKIVMNYKAMPGHGKAVVGVWGKR